MTDELGSRKNGRRRRTTRRLARRPIRVPGDDVPRQSVSPFDPDEDLDVDADNEHGDETAEPADQDATRSDDRRSADSIDVDVELDAAADGGSSVAEPTSGVVHAPQRVASVPPPPPAISSLPPRMPALGALPDERRALEPDVDVKTNPQIRIMDLARNASSLPPPTTSPAPRADMDREEPTRPRIEISREMALSAGRVTSLDIPRDSFDEPDLETNPRIAISIEDDAPPSVVVSRARIISDRPEPATIRPQAPSKLPSMRPSARPPSGDIEDFETIDLEVGDADRISSPDLPLSAVVPGATRGSDPARSSKSPPPPPDGPGKPALKKPNLGSAASTAPQPPSIVQKAPPPPPPPSAAPKKPAGKPGPRRRQWWDDFFSDDYLQSVLPITPAQIAHQVDFMEASLALPKGAAVLDVGCGLGLHALELARRGYLVVGLDLSLPMITRAAEAAQQEGLRINFLHTDVRELGFQAMFDAIVCVGTTFGFFDEDANRDTLARLAAALKPGGKLFLDVVNRDHVVRSQPNLVWFEGEGCVVMEESDFNYFSSRLVVKRTMMREDGRQSEAEYSIRLYSLHELGQMLQQVGFRVSEVSGQEATRGMFFGGESARIILVAERRAAKGGNGQAQEPDAGSAAESGKPSA